LYCPRYEYSSSNNESLYIAFLSRALLRDKPTGIMNGMTRGINTHTPRMRASAQSQSKLSQMAGCVYGCQYEFWNVYPEVCNLIPVHEEELRHIYISTTTTIKCMQIFGLGTVAQCSKASAKVVVRKKMDHVRMLMWVTTPYCVPLL
jgi:hypothetical protein